MSQAAKSTTPILFAAGTAAAVTPAAPAPTDAPVRETPAGESFGPREMHTVPHVSSEYDMSMYLVVNDYGKFGRAFVETDIAEADWGIPIPGNGEGEDRVPSPPLGRARVGFLLPSTSRARR
jgi:hypothetical protein